MKLTSFGAAGEVTGSMHLIEAFDYKVLLDCGMFQSGDMWRNLQLFPQLNSKTAPIEPSDVDAVVLSHAHIDHCGRLPLLYAQGFRGPIFTTPATSEAAEIMLLDAAQLQQESLVDTDETSNMAMTGLVESVRGVCDLFETLDYGELHAPTSDFRLRLSNAGHIIGSAICELELSDFDDAWRIIFSGDVGRRGFGLFGDPTIVDGGDLLIVESTYGNRVHSTAQNSERQFLDILQNTLSTGGRVVIPAFSLGRTQQLTHLIGRFIQSGELSRVPVFVDSPLSKRITSVYQRFPELIAEGIDPAGCVTYTSSQKESLELNDLDEPVIIISASGMCENGRVLHHIKRAAFDSRNTICLVGFQAEGSLGRQLANGVRNVTIHERSIEIKCSIALLEGLSAHADAEDLKLWCNELGSRGGIGQAVVVHGEPSASQALADLIRDDCDDEPVIAESLKTIEFSR